MRKFSLLIALCLSFFSGSLFAEVKIIATEIAGIHQKDKNGSYDQIIMETVGKAELATLNIYPPARAKAIFSSCQNCCFTPANKNAEFYDLGKDIVQTDPMNIAKIYIFVAPEQPPIHRLEDLRGKTVGIRTGMSYGKNFDNAKLKTQSVTTIEQNIKMIKAGRIDAFIAYTPDAYQAFKKLGIWPYPHAFSHPIAVHQDRLICRGVEPEFITKFNGMLKKLDTSGRLKEILGNNGLFN